MRIESNSRPLQVVELSYWTNDPGKPRVFERTQPVSLSERSDVQINPKDKFGFRSPSPYKGNFFTYDPPYGDVVFTREKPHPNDWRHRVYGVEPSSFRQIFGDTLGGYADWENSLKQQALRSIKDQRVNLTMTLAFLPETLKMIRGNFSTISSVLRSARSSDWKTVGRLLKVDSKSTADFYLQVLFGWLQLIRDTQGIVEELHRKCNKPKHTFVYGRAKRSQEISPITVVKQPYESLASIGNYRFQGDRHIDHNLVMIFRGETALLSRLSQLGLTNPLELMWDLVPWSWVINMGVSIGDFLSTLDATVGLTYLGGSYTRYSRVAGPVTIEDIPPSRNRVSESFSSTPGFYEQVKFERRVISDKVDPFVLKNPFSAPLALTGAVVAAVVQQGRKGAPQPPRGRTRTIMS